MAHEAHAVEPVLVENVPAAQVAQELEAAAAWKLPAGHDVHAEAEAVEYVPAAQLEQAPAPAAVLNEPAPQLEQVDAPLAAWKVPAAQGVQEVTSWPAEKVPATHLTQPPAPLKEPAAHRVCEQALEPAVAV